MMKGSPKYEELDSEDQSIPTETEDIVISTSEPEIKEAHVSLIVVVAEDHDQLHYVEVETQIIHEENDEDLNDDVEFLKEINFTGISDDIPTNIELDIDDDEFGPFPGFDNNCFRKVNEVASSATKTKEDSNVLKILLSASKPLEISSGQRDVNLEIRPSVSTVSTSAPLVVQSSQSQTSQSFLERNQSNTSLEVPIVSHAPQVFSTVTTTTVFTPPIQSNEGPSTMFETGISFKEEHSGEDKSTVSELREQISVLGQELIEKNIQLKQLVSHVEELKERDEEKTKQIKDLQTNRGSMTAFYFNLKNVLYDAFADKVKALFQQPHGIEDPPMAPTQSTSGDLLVDPPPPRTTTIVDRFVKEPEGSRARITIKQGKRNVMANKSEGLLFLKNSNENRRDKNPVLTVTDLKKRKFGDEFGDRSRIKMWAFDPELNMWVVKRNLGISEYYKSTHDFNSWTKVDLAELSRAPFYNPSEDPGATNFKRFLDRQVRENFPKMKTARALYRKDQDILDPESGKPMRIILWPTTKQQKEIPIPHHFREGYLNNMELWAYDDETATAVIKFKDREHVLRLISAKDLLRFRERDIHTLSHH
ncbi:unnamed protein product [Lactuca saligna]|uniref:Uncharacterized protein n=1 Tax=Lactuca saligna TaxID=75948 RepID=A0AA35YN02_LACSI|nr:unnamed protein product [Lactuca saligna]